MAISKILSKISWITRRWCFTFSLLKIDLHDHFGSWGFSLFNLGINLRTYSLLRIEFRLPNMTNVQKFTIDSWDFLFLYNFLFNQYDDLSERKLWGSNLSRWERIKLSLLDKIIK